MNLQPLENFSLGGSHELHIVLRHILEAVGAGVDVSEALSELANHLHVELVDAGEKIHDKVLNHALNIDILELISNVVEDLFDSVVLEALLLDEAVELLTDILHSDIQHVLD